MFGGKCSLQTGSEYHDVLISFIKKENEQGHISLVKYNRLTYIKNCLFLLCVLGFTLFVTSINHFLNHASIFSLIGTVVFGFTVIIILFVFSIVPFCLQSKVESIEARFDDDSLIRLCKHGAPDDVIDSIISAFGRTADLSYGEIYDIFWLCSRNGIDNAILLGERYQQIRKRIRSKILTKDNVK